MFLDYLALGLLVFTALVLFYGLIAIHDIPHEIAKERNHPHQDAIGVAGWISLFTLHVIWPLLWIWSMLYRPDRGWGFESPNGMPDEATSTQLADLHEKVEQLESELGELRNSSYHG